MVAGSNSRRRRGGRTHIVGDERYQAHGQLVLCQLVAVGMLKQLVQIHALKWLLQCLSHSTATADLSRPTAVRSVLSRSSSLPLRYPS